MYNERVDTQRAASLSAHLASTAEQPIQERDGDEYRMVDTYIRA